MSGLDQEITVTTGGAGDEKGPKEPKRVSVFRFGKAGKTMRLLQSRGRGRRKKKKKEKDGLVNSGCCCLCTKQPPVSDHSSCESPCSDPNSKEFRLRFFIEKNDFHAAECNPHLDSAD